MEQSLRNRLRELLGAISPTRETPSPQDEGNANLAIVVVASHRSSMPHATTHWAIAVITDEHSRQCRVFHVSDGHIHGLRALGWTAFVQDETLDEMSSCQGGVRIGVVERHDLRRLEEAICGNRVPPPTSDLWDCEDWTIAVIRHLEDEGFRLATFGLDNGTLIKQLITDSLQARTLTERYKSRPVFVPLSPPSVGH